MAETRARRRIRAAVEAACRQVEEITWEPIRPGSEMAGADGGWTVIATDGKHALGYNVDEVVAAIDRWAR